MTTPLLREATRELIEAAREVAAERDELRARVARLEAALGHVAGCRYIRQCAGCTERARAALENEQKSEWEVSK